MAFRRLLEVIKLLKMGLQKRPGNIFASRHQNCSNCASRSLLETILLKGYKNAENEPPHPAVLTHKRSTRTHKGLTKGSQRTNRRTHKDSQGLTRTHKGLTKDSKDSQRIHKDSLTKDS
jgi:hypothetical protein